MSWTDRKSIEHIKKIRDIFNVSTLVETGTFKGMNVLAHKDNFELLYSCEKIKKYYEISEGKCINYGNIQLYNKDSKSFLKWFRDGIPQFNKNDKIIFYLDAHFYDKNLPKNKRFVVLDELKQLKGLKNAIIIIHDFDNGLGHITYDGISLDMNLLRKDLLKVNPKFHFYTNELSSCDVINSVDELYASRLKGYDKDRWDNLLYAWSKPEKTYRGLLYCVPKKIKIEGLREIK